MTKVRALTKGYVGGVIREPGEVFAWPEGEAMGKWVKPEPFGGKGDHDGDGKPGGSKGGSESTAAKGVAARGENVKAVIVVPADWRSMSAADRKVLAGQIAGKEVKRASDADAIIDAHVEATKPEPFGEAPAPQTVAEATAAIGGVQPDWVAPGSPEPVTD